MGVYWFLKVGEALHSEVIVNSLPPFPRYVKRSRPENI